MKYDLLIRRAWRLTWRNRFLWVLGLFGVSTVGTWWFGGGWREGSAPEYRVERLPASDEEALEALTGWIGQHVVLLVAALGVLALLGIACVVLALVAQGGMARATLNLALGRPITPRQAWRSGARFAWRFLGLWLVLLGLTLAAAALLAAIFVPLGALAADPRGPGVVAPVLLALLGLLVLLVGIPLALALSVAAAFAQRVMVDADVGPWTALTRGVGLVRARFGASAVAWLVNLVLGIVAALAIGAGAAALLIPLGAAGVLAYLVAGLSAPGVAAIILAGLAFVLGVWLLAAIGNTFFWCYWTLVYLHFTGQLTETLERPPSDLGGHQGAPSVLGEAPALPRELTAAGR